MLEQVDLKQKITRKRHSELMPDLEIRLGSLQRAAIEARLPVVILFEGIESAGKGEIINRVVRALDPRGYHVFSPDDFLQPERERPYPWRFWTRTPERGRMAIFDRGWGWRLLDYRLHDRIKTHELDEYYGEINSFERQLATDGCVIIKLFLHVSEKEQKKQYHKAKRTSSGRSWIGGGERLRPRDYTPFCSAADDLLESTHTPLAPWRLIAAENRRFATVAIFETICDSLASALERTGGVPDVSAQTPRDRSGAAFETAEPEAGANHLTGRRNDKDGVRPGGKVGIGRRRATGGAGRPGEGPLSRVDLSLTVSRDEYDKRLDRYQTRMRKLQDQAYDKGVPVVIAYEGWDAAGKGGNIKRLTRGLDPRGYEVVPVGPPTDVEKRHHYLWRFWKAMPRAGRFTIFDRTWYGRVLVERVEGFCAEADWRRAYDEINEMEKQLTRFGTVLVKFWLHIDKDEQLKRFEEREKTPYKRWKITPDDWRNREKWDRYLEAVEEMLIRTSTPHAPWTVVESNSKHYARLKAIHTVIKAVEKKL